MTRALLFDLRRNWLRAPGVAIWIFLALLMTGLLPGCASNLSLGHDRREMDRLWEEYRKEQEIWNSRKDSGILVRNPESSHD